MRSLSFGLMAAVVMSACGTDTAHKAGPESVSSLSTQTATEGMATENTAEAKAGTTDAVATSSKGADASSSGARASEGAPASAPAPEPVPLPAASEAASSVQKPPREVTGKPSAPVTISGQVGENAVAVEVHFLAEARDVTVRVWGTEGLELRGESEPVHEAEVRKGHRLKLEVPFTAPAGRGDLAVSVSGRFGGSQQSQVRSFSVNADSGTRERSSAEEKVDASGRPVKVMKSH